MPYPKFGPIFRVSRALTFSKLDPFAKLGRSSSLSPTEVIRTIALSSSEMGIKSDGNCFFTLFRRDALDEKDIELVTSTQVIETDMFFRDEFFLKYKFVNGWISAENGHISRLLSVGSASPVSTLTGPYGISTIGYEPGV